MKDLKENQVTDTDTNAEISHTSNARDGARRKVLNTGVVGAAAAVLGLVAAACSSDDDDNAGSAGSAGTGLAGASGAAGEPPMAGAPATSGAGGVGGAGGAPAVDADVGPLNALLSAEYNAITAYTAGAGLIGMAAMSDPLYALREVITDVAVSIQSQHKLHAAALVDAIGELDGVAVKEADIAKAFAAPKGLTDNPTISNVLKFAASAERGAAVAYNQVLAGMEDAKYRFLASSIEGDETQHFIVLAALVLGLADPGPMLSTTTATKVVPAAFVSTVNAVAGLDKAPPPDYYP